MADYILSKTGEEVEAILNSVGDKANANEVYSKTEIDGIVSGINEDIEGINTSMSNIKSDISDINSSVTNLGTAVSDINTAIGNINVILERKI